MYTVAEVKTEEENVQTMVAHRFLLSLATDTFSIEVDIFRVCFVMHGLMQGQ